MSTPAHLDSNINTDFAMLWCKHEKNFEELDQTKGWEAMIWTSQRRVKPLLFHTSVATERSACGER